MDEEVREKMISAIEKAAREAGAQDYEEGLKSVIKFTEFLNTNARSIQTTEGLRKVLDSCEPLSKSEEKLALFAMEHLSSILRICFKLAAKKAAATLPPPPSGRPPAFCARESEEVLDYISALHRKGSLLDAAKERASQKFGRSRRTIERLWSNRGSIAEDKPTIEAVISRISKGE